MGDSFEIQNLARSCHELLILATIGSAWKHGYQIALEIEEGSGGFFQFNHGTLYPILHHLEKEALIDGRWTQGQGRRKRKEYALTARGRDQLGKRAAEWRAFWERLGSVVGREAEPVPTGATAGQR
jgi:PadR family transcriptional regulator, regulatory protein PadR